MGPDHAGALGSWGLNGCSSFDRRERITVEVGMVGQLGAGAPSAGVAVVVPGQRRCRRLWLARCWGFFVAVVGR